VRTAIDTNVISSLWSSEPLAGQVSRLLSDARAEGGLVICGVVYAELLAHPKATDEFVNEFLAATGVDIDFDLGEDAWREAGRRFAQYAVRRRAARGGSSKRLLADFLVGTHAFLQSDRLLTADGGVYQQDFPELEIVAA